MRDLEKYRGIIPAFYACYEDDGSVSPERTREFTRYLINKGVKGLYAVPQENAYTRVKKREN